MSDLNFIFYSLKARWLNTILSILLTSFGVTLALLITQFGNHIQKRLQIDGQGIDIVVGAKGSPLQLILSSIYHIDIPTGNISYQKAKEIVKNPKIKEAIPLALGDNWRGYRIVGTTFDYIKNYNGKIDEGRIWNKEFEIVAGSDVGLKINDEFSGAHGLSDGGNIHHHERYRVIGKLEPTGSVLDRLILTSLNSVLQIHGLKNINFEENNNRENHVYKDNHVHKDNHEENHKYEDNHAEHHDHENNEEHHDHENNEEHHDHENNGHAESHNQNSNTKSGKIHKDILGTPEITALLIKTKTPISNINLPRQINREGSFQAANPAMEMARLTSMLGIGSNAFGILSLILISIAALSIFSGLTGNFENRMRDLAVLRAIGYLKSRIFKVIIMEGIIIVSTGIFFGIIFGLGGFKILTQLVTPLNVSHASISFSENFFLIIIIVFLSGLISAILPAYRGCKISVAKQLSKTI